MYWTMCGKQGGVIGMCIGRVLDDVWTAVRVIGMCIGRVLDDVWTTGRGNRYVYWTMAWSTVTVIGSDTVTSVRGKTVCRLIWETRYGRTYFSEHVLRHGARRHRGHLDVRRDVN